MESYSVKAVLSATDNMSGVFQKAASSAGSFRQKMGSSLQAVGKTSTVLGLAVGAMTGKAIKSYGDFQESINKAAVIAGSSNKKLGSNMKDLEKVALSLGKTLPISAEDAGNAMIEMARNGASIKDLKKEFPSIAKAAAVSGADLSATATTVQQAMNIWGGGAKNAAKDSATLAIVANKSNAEVGDMQQVFANVGTTAKNMGYSLKDVAIAAGVMTNAGIPAAQASMDLNHAFTQMVKPSKTAQGEMKKLGLSYTNAQGEMKPLKTVIKDVANATKGMSGAQKTAALNMLFGAAGAKAMAPLLDSVGDKAKKSGKGWDSFSSAIDKGAGSAKKANKYLNENSQNMTKNVGQSLAQMADAFDALIKTSIGSIAPQIRAVADALGDFATWLNNSKSPLAGFVKKMIALSPIIAGVLVVFGLLATGVGKLISAFSAPAKALGAFSKGTQTAGKYAGVSAGKIAAMGVKAIGVGAGIGLAAAGLAIFAVGVAQLAKTGKDGVIALTAMTISISALAGVFALVGPILQSSVAGMVAFGATIVLVGAGMAIMVASFTAFQQAGGNSVALIASLTVGISTMAAVFAFLGPMLTAGALGMIAFSAAITLVGAGVALMATSLATLANAGVSVNATIIVLTLAFAAVTAVLALLGPLLTAGALGFLALGAAALMIGAGIAMATAGIATVINSITNLIKALSSGKSNSISFASIATSAFRGLGSAGGSIFNALKGIVTSSMKTLSSVGKSAATSLANVAKSAWQGLKGAASGIWNGIKSAISSAINGAKSTVSSAVNGMKSAATSAWNGMKSVASSTVSGIRSVFHSLSSINLSSAGSAIMNSFKSGLTSAFNGVKSFVSGIAGWIKEHKGPISLDRKLLIPAGNAIMDGFNSGLVSQFGTVQNNIKKMTSNIAGMASDALNNNVQALNSRVNGSISSNFNTTMDQSPIDNVANKVIAAIREGHYIVLDGNTLVGHTADRIDNHLGNNVRLRGRLS